MGGRQFNQSCFARSKPMTRKEVIENKPPLCFDVHGSVSKLHGI